MRNDVKRNGNGINRKDSKPIRPGGYTLEDSRPVNQFCQYSSAVEQIFCKDKVGGSIPSTGSGPIV